MKLVSLIVLAAIFCFSAISSAAVLTYPGIVSQITDLEALAVPPAQGETCAQWSSYDRASKYDPAQIKYVNWDANGDNAGIMRQEGSLLVLGEIKGPGCIRRIWSAQPLGGHVKIYLDGAKTPQIDLPFSSYFDGSTAPFNYPALVHVVSQGCNNYVPIPFTKSCKIVAEPGWGNYYHFTYTTFPKGTVVPTFTMKLSKEDLFALSKANDLLTKGLGSDPSGKRNGEVTDAKAITVDPGKSVVLENIDGPKAITALKIKLANLEQITDISAALRDVVLKISWDDEKQPAVWAPLGDFFGTAPGINKYKSLPLGMTDDGFYSYWYMPFGKKAILEISNEGSEAVSLETNVTTAPLEKPADQLMRFHAKWHRDAFLPKEPERWIDWPMLKTYGKGRFCGVALHVWNPRGSWWGEGDEKFFVDGEKMPSTFGTGSEDYFGYAWCNPTLFQHALHDETRSDGNSGHISVNRWHIVDNIPYQKSFEGDIEKYFPNNRPTLYASAVYWYQDSPAGDPYYAVPASERWGIYNYQRKAIKGGIEGEDLEVIEITGGERTNQGMANFSDGWNNDSQLWWTGAKPKDKLVLKVPVKESGKYELRGAFTKANDYGIMQLYFDGTKLGGPIDFYNPSVIPSGEILLGTVDASAGQHRLTVEIIGANDAAIKSYMFGIDYLRLVKQN